MAQQNILLTQYNFAPMTKKKILAVLKSIIIDYNCKLKLHDIAFESHFKNDLGIDSLDIMEIIAIAEHQFNCDISDEEACRIKTVADLVNIIFAKKESL